MDSQPHIARVAARPSAAPVLVRPLLVTAAVTAAGGFLFGYDTAVINGANSYLTAHLHLTATQEGMTGSSAILGCIPGAMFAGGVADRFGRRRILFLCAFLYAISGVLSALPRTFDEFICARFISGLGIGASSMICPVYIAEISPERWRGRLGSLFQLGIVTGIFVTLFVNKLIQGLGDETWNMASGWRWMLGLETIPAVTFAALLFSAPESPRWLAQNGRQAEARSLFERVAGGPDGADLELRRIAEAAAQEQGGFMELFSTYRKPFVIALLLMAFSQFCGINAIIYYSSKIFATAGAGNASAFASSVWMALINVLFTLVAIACVDRAGRKILLLIGTLAQTVSLIAVGYMFHAQRSGRPLLAAVVMFIAAFAMAMGPIPWILCSEIFPNKVRGRAMAASTFVIWSSCYIVAQTFPMLNDNPAIGPALTFWTYAAVSLLSFIFVWVMVPETKNRRLEEIELFWTRPRDQAR